MPETPPVISPVDASILSPPVGEVVNVNTPPTVPVMLAEFALPSQ